MIAAPLASIAAAIPSLPAVSVPPPPLFDAAAPLAATVGANPRALLDAARSLYDDRATISQTIHHAIPLVAAAAADIGAIGQGFLNQAIALAPVLTGPGAVAGLAHLARAASEALIAVAERLDRLEKELDPLVRRLDGVVSAALGRPPLIPPASALAAQEELRALAAEPGSAPEKKAAAVPTEPAGSAAPADAGPGSSDGGSAVGRAAVAAAKSQLGTPYVWGGSQPGGFDCSGLTSWSYRQAGLEIPRTAENQAIGKQVSYDELQPGDLVVWSGHVAMYAGDGMMVEAGNPVQMNPVRTSNIGMPFKGFWRPTA